MNQSNYYERIILVVNTVLFLLDMIATFIVRDFGEIVLHYKMHLIEIPLQIISFILIYDSLGWTDISFAGNSLQIHILVNISLLRSVRLIALIAEIKQARMLFCTL